MPQRLFGEFLVQDIKLKFITVSEFHLGKHLYLMTLLLVLFGICEIDLSCNVGNKIFEEIGATCAY